MQQIEMQTSSSTHVFENRWYRRHHWFLLLNLFNGTVAVIGGVRSNSRWMLAVGIFIFLMLAISSRQYFRNRLLVTPQGITYQSGWSVLHVPWQDMEYIGRSLTRSWYRGWEGIIPRVAHWENPRWILWPARWRPQFIPVWNRSMGALWDRALFDDIFHYAPWLAGYGKDATVSR